MQRSLALLIGLRYTRSKCGSHFISFISFTSMIGIALGVAVLITVLSVMNGFDTQIKERVFSLAREVTVTNFQNRIDNWQPLGQKIANTPGVVASEPYVSGQGMLTYSGQVHPVLVSGIFPDKEKQLSELADNMIAGRLSDLKPGEYGIVLGRDLATSLDAYLGDKITLVTADASLTPAGVLLRTKRFKVVGIFSAGNGFGFDSLWAFIHIKDAQTLFKLGNSIQGFWVKTPDLYRTSYVVNRILSVLPSGYIASDWTQEYGAFFQAIHLEKTMMTLILLLLVAIAAFNLVSSLVMVVTDKRADIAILRTLGAHPKTIMGIFIIQGALIGFVGTVLGVIGGIVLAQHVTDIVKFLESTLHIQLISASVYYIDYLPSQIEVGDVIRISLAALGMSLLATLYPAYRASRVQPAEALRYE